jgi:hypothetical protein
MASTRRGMVEAIDCLIKEYFQEVRHLRVASSLRVKAVYPYEEKQQ